MTQVRGVSALFLQMLVEFEVSRCSESRWESMTSVVCLHTYIYVYIYTGAWKPRRYFEFIYTCTSQSWIGFCRLFVWREDSDCEIDVSNGIVRKERNGPVGRVWNIVQFWVSPRKSGKDSNGRQLSNIELPQQCAACMEFKGIHGDGRRFSSQGVDNGSFIALLENSRTWLNSIDAVVFCLMAACELPSTAT